MSEDWSISPPLPDKVFPWEKYNPVTREEVNEFFHSPEILVIKERMCDIGRRLWNREYVDSSRSNSSTSEEWAAWSCKRSLSGGLENLFRTGYNNN